MFESLKENLIQEKKIISKIRQIDNDFSKDSQNRAHYISGIKSLIGQLIILNKSVPKLLEEEFPSVKKEEVKGQTKKESDKITRISYISPSTKEKNYINISKQDRDEFLKRLRLSEDNLSRLKKKKEVEDVEVVKRPSKFVAFSNKYFGGLSEKISPKFSDISLDLKKANIRFLLSTYISLAICSTFLTFFGSFVLFFVLLLFGVFNISQIWIPIIITLLVPILFYFYPASEASSVQKKISQELPFATIHMAAIASSDIEPTRIFKIIATSREYPNVGYEIRKVLAQVEIYGYDLVASLKDVSERVSNKKLADLFSGLATNISTGGELKSYLEKKSENLLLDYRLEREKFTDLAGTFMDVYISILIAAPLILMMMFIVMDVAGLGLGDLSIEALLILSVGGIVIVNIIFLFALNYKQPAV